ncbi:MAG: pyridoxal phosphate-dependent aminotransferase [Christensenellaceae bacterium]
MLNETMMGLGKKRSVIREIFEYGLKRSAEIGKENVFDYSLGNPSIPAPPSVNETLIRLLQEGDSVALHGYTSAQGGLSTRRAIAASINRRFGKHTDENLIYMTCGAAASLRICFSALVNEGDEIIAFAPCFPEYRVFVESSGAKFILLPVTDESFQIDSAMLEQAITPRTKAIVINSPNNPSGVVYDAETLRSVAAVLEKKSKEYGAPVYLIADEPYRELVYDKQVPYPMDFYDDTVVCYSWSKALSLPGERIGYIALSDRMQGKEDVFAAIAGAGRSLGYVCAPALFQKLVELCGEDTADISAYRRNRDTLVSALREYGFSCVEPDGAFYLFVKAPGGDGDAFCEEAKKYELLLVPGADFGCPDYVRIAYCVSFDTIVRSLSAFYQLSRNYFGGNS